jgi:hypothetical protein
MLGADLTGAFDRGRTGPGGWVLLDEPELHFGNDVLVPDLAGWRRERLPAVPKDAFLTLAPDARRARGSRARARGAVRGARARARGALGLSRLTRSANPAPRPAC